MANKDALKSQETDEDRQTQLIMKFINDVAEAKKKGKSSVSLQDGTLLGGTHKNATNDEETRKSRLESNQRDEAEYIDNNRDILKQETN